MPTGTNITRCVECGTTFMCGDCINPFCDDCECKKLGHIVLPLFGICSRCGKKIDDHSAEESVVESDFRKKIEELKSDVAFLRKDNERLSKILSHTTNISKSIIAYIQQMINIVELSIKETGSKS